jgi:hypothetical protein
MKGLKEIFERLGMNDQNGLFLTAKENWKSMLPARIVGLLLKDKLRPEAFFCIDNKPIVLFYNSPKNKDGLFKAIWNFNESPVVIINEPDTVGIFNGLSYLKEEKTLAKLEDESKLNVFSYFKLVTGKTWQDYENKFKYQNRVDYKLLENIRAARDILVNDYEIDSSLSNALIGKCIFIRYLIDRHVRIKFDGTLREWKNDEFCSLLSNKTRTIRFLNYLKDQFNGEAFLLEDSNLKEIPGEAFGVLSRLMQGTEIATGQMSLFDIYDFSIIPVEFISNVYEHFIGEENQAKKGAYYTPVFLVDYILTETVEKYFDGNPEEYNCKVLDPACGSGIFLVEALRRMIEHYKDINKITSTRTKSFKDILRKITEENIYGIDQDENAINVAVFSIYLALLDYQDPKDIENFKFPKLINKNFFTNDFFDLDADFNNIIKTINFNFILGNPPWKRGSDKNALFMKYIKARKKRESSEANGKPQATISNNEIAQAFLLRTSDFSTTQTRCALIVTSKTFYNLNGKDFRKYLLHNYFIDKFFELAPVRREVFDRSNDPSIAPAAILFFHYAHGDATDKNVIKHIALKPNRFFSLFKIFMLQRNDYKQVIQYRLIKHDWLWKTLVYGSYIDFNFIKRLKDDYTTIDKIIYNENKFLVKQGLKKKDGDKKINIEQLVDWAFLDKDKKELKQFYIAPCHEKWKISTVGYIYRENNSVVADVFTPPSLLVSDAVNNKYQSITALSLSKLVFTDKTTSIKAYSKKDINCLRILSGLLNLNLFAYYILQTGSNIGIEREQVHDKEKFSFPYLNNPTIAQYVEKIESISKKLFNKKQTAITPTQTLEDEKKKLIEDLNDEILSSFDLDEQERVLVDYAVNITIPLIMKHKGYEKELFQPLKIEDPFLTNYAEVFLNRFRNSFERRNKKFTLQILHSNYIIGMFFRVTNKANNKEPISWEKTSENNLLQKLSSLGYQKITESLFIQKDVRGFEKDGFYVIKPNEKKLWHKAIAYLDAEEFADAMLREGKGRQNV